MPKIGDIKTGSGRQKYVWAACDTCSKERWVRLLHGEPCYQKCRSCVKLKDGRLSKKEIWQRYYQKHKAEIIEKNKRDYVEHLVERKQVHREYWRRLKIEVLTHYGNGKFACVKCGEARHACLSLDHLNGNGCRHRQNVGTVYNFLKRNKYPEGYQTLCMNCQFVKRVEKREYGGRAAPDDEIHEAYVVKCNMAKC